MGIHVKVNVCKFSRYDVTLKPFGAGKALHMFSLLIKTFRHLKPQLVSVIIPILLSMSFL